jgi:hypothetical protein
MGPCIVLSNIRDRISNEMQLYTVYLCLGTALHILGGISTHNQERIQLYLQHLVLVTPIMLPAAIAEGHDERAEELVTCKEGYLSLT